MECDSQRPTHNKGNELELNPNELPLPLPSINHSKVHIKIYIHTKVSE
jgi:hypothetical protein